MTLQSATVGKLSDHSRRKAVWAAPVLVVAAVAIGATIVSGSASGASPNLAPRTAAQLLAAVQTANTSALSGDFQETSNLGIPALPGGQDSASLSWQSFITGTHTARVWADGADKQRVALIGQLSEADVVHNGSNLWTYTSATNTVTHTVLPTHDTGTTTQAPDARELTPAAAAARVLEAISPSTTVTVSSTRMVAGRAAYTLALAPKDANSTVSKVTIAIDAAESVPLQVQVFGSGSSPAFQTGFTAISFSRPAASVFDFHAPAGAKTASNPFTGPTSSRSDGHSRHHQADGRGPDVATAPATNSSAKPRVIGSGWTSVLELPAGRNGSQSLTSALPTDLTSSVGNSGERLLHTALINAVLLPDGRTFVGAVTPAYLEHLAATTAR